ncbi:hypothetical protein [Arthrobacter sp. H5]|uniref:hypothetical protein n=1 Tax=Arthrobacter sp. H5 TaxID=1267973 RepID=UPI0004BA3D50|nr:hypothetical protein [Arthrobacter sp. H5]
MRATVALPILAASTALLVACGADYGFLGRACTEMGALHGFSLTIAKEMTPDITDPVLEVCDSTCRTLPIELTEGSDTVEQGCTGDNPEDSCSAISVPNGTLVASINDPTLTTAEVTLTLTNGSTEYTLTATPEMVYPNGQDCPAAGPQLSLLLAQDRLSVSATVP